MNASRLVLLAALAAPLFATAARAQSAADKAAAESLFTEGVRLHGQAKCADALPKLIESQRLDPGLGTMLYIADCYEQTGKTASAWAEFKEVEELAAKANDRKRTEIAHDRVAKLEPTLARVAIKIAAPVDGMDVKRDGAPVGRAQWGVPVVVDPGQHVVSATAPGKRAWEKTIAIPPAAGTTEIEIPALEAAESAPVAPPPAATVQPVAVAPIAAPPAPAAASRGSTQRTIGLVAGGVGIVAIGAGAFFGVQAKSKLDDSNGGHCRADNHCDATGVSLRSDAQSAATISTIGFGVGVAALAGGAILYFTAPKKGGPSVGIAPLPGGAMLEGRF